MPSLPSFLSKHLTRQDQTKLESPAEDQDPVSQYLLRSPRCTIKILVLGTPGVGKRSLCSRLSEDIFPQGPDPSEDGHYRRLVVLPAAQSSHQVLVEWTTILADASRIIPSVIRYMVRENEACMLVYRVDSRASFDAVEGLVRHHVHANRDDAVLFVVANCVDVPREQWAVTEDEGRALARRLGADAFSCSAKTGQGCGLEIMQAIVEAVLLRRLGKRL